MRRSYKKKRGGEVPPFPAQYYDPTMKGPDAGAGRDLLHAAGMDIRPRIGGRRHSKRISKRNRTKKGGFIPSVMDGFVAASSKYIVPLVLFSGYKLMKKGTPHFLRKSAQKSRRRTRK